MTSPYNAPVQGEIWLADLNPPVGHEQAGPPRPVLILSGRTMNQAPYRLSFIVPLTTKIRRVPGHIFISSADSGLRADSEILCEHLRSISHDRFRRSTPIARVRSEIIHQVMSAIGMLMDP